MRKLQSFHRYIIFVFICSYKKQAQLRLCKLGPGTFFLIRFFPEIKFLSVALLSQAKRSECGTV